MSNRTSQPADSAVKLMVEAFAKASAELEKYVTAFSEQLISFNESLQKSLEDELRAVNMRLANSVASNLDDLVHNKHLMMKRLLEAERKELEALSDAGRQVRSALSSNAQQAEVKIEEFMGVQVKQLKDYLEQPQKQISTTALEKKSNLESTAAKATADIAARKEQVCRQLADNVAGLEESVKQEAEKVRTQVMKVSEGYGNELQSECQSIANSIGKSVESALGSIESMYADRAGQLRRAEEADKESLGEVSQVWEQQISNHCASFDKAILSLSSVLKENFETKLATVSDQARLEINLLSDQAHDRILATRNELEAELKDLEKECLRDLEQVLHKLEALASEHASDKANSAVARQHKSQKLRDRMRTHLKRWGASLADSVKGTVPELENEFNVATDGFHARIETARTSSIELLERESKVMQKDVDRVYKDFQRELKELETQLSKVETAGEDAVVTVIACRKAMLSLKGE